MIAEAGDGRGGWGRVACSSMNKELLRPRVVNLLLVGCALALAGLGACDRGDATKAKKAAKPAQQPVEPATPKPEYVFADGLEEQYPQVVGFLRRFMETSLAGDYAGYRRLVSRLADPASRARFEKILNSLQKLSVETIEPVELAEGPSPAYRVISRVEFLPHQKVGLRRGDNSRVAILVFAEEGELRMVPAPSEHQPASDESEPTSGPTATAPSYPWDAEGDY